MSSVINHDFKDYALNMLLASGGASLMVSTAIRGSCHKKVGFTVYKTLRMLNLANDRASRLKFAAHTAKTIKWLKTNESDIVAHTACLTATVKACMDSRELQIDKKALEDDNTKLSEKVKSLETSNSDLKTEVETHLDFICKMKADLKLQDERIIRHEVHMESLVSDLSKQIEGLSKSKTSGSTHPTRKEEKISPTHLETSTKGLNNFPVYAYRTAVKASDVAHIINVKIPEKLA